MATPNPQHVSGGCWAYECARSLFTARFSLSILGMCLLVLRRGSDFSKTFGIFLATHNEEESEAVLSAGSTGAVESWGENVCLQTSQITMGGWAEEHLQEEARVFFHGTHLCSA